MGEVMFSVFLKAGILCRAVYGYIPSYTPHDVWERPWKMLSRGRVMPYDEIHWMDFILFEIKWQPADRCCLCLPLFLCDCDFSSKIIF